MTLMRSSPGVPIAVPQYRRSRSLYERPGLAGSPGDAILSAVKWVYDGGAAFDEAFDRDGDARAHYRGIVGVLESFTQGEVSRRERLQKLALMDQRITFTIYGEKEGLERIFPFDFVPRVVTAREWERLEAGLVQRVTALNLFIDDVYGEQKCLKDNVLPPALLLSRKEYKRELLNVRPPRGVYTHVVGTDIIRDDRGEFLVLEDNCRCPSGVSYVLENRNLMTRVFPELFAPTRCVRSRTIRTSCSTRCCTRPRAPPRARWRSCSRPASTTRRSSSTRSSRARWGRRSWRGATSSSRTTTCSCARRADGSAWTSSTAASTRTSSIRSCSGATACSACRACSTPTGRATWPSPTLPAPAWPTTSPSTPSCRSSSSTTSARRRGSGRCRRTSASGARTSPSFASTRPSW